jgi:hypothetical protein
VEGACCARLHRGTQPPPTPGSAHSTASCCCAASLFDLAAPYLPPLPPRVTSLHTVVLHAAQLLVVVMHSSSSFSCCRSRTCFGLAASQVPPRPSSPSYHCARPRCPPCGSAPSRHASAPSTHARTAHASLARDTSRLYHPCQITLRGACLHAPTPPVLLAPAPPAACCSTRTALVPAPPALACSPLLGSRTCAASYLHTPPARCSSHALRTPPARSAPPALCPAAA